jgi:hypothetical protein
MGECFSCTGTGKDDRLTKLELTCPPEHGTSQNLPILPYCTRVLFPRLSYKHSSLPHKVYTFRTLLDSKLVFFTPPPPPVHTCVHSEGFPCEAWVCDHFVEMKPYGLAGKTRQAIAPACFSLLGRPVDMENTCVLTLQHIHNGLRLYPKYLRRVIPEQGRFCHFVCSSACVYCLCTHTHTCTPLCRWHINDFLFEDE